MEKALLVIAIFLVVLLVCREITCWYLKINETLAVLREIRDLLRPASPSRLANVSGESVVRGQVVS